MPSPASSYPRPWHPLAAVALALAVVAHAPAHADPANPTPKLTKAQTAAVAAYDKALAAFKAILAQRRAEIDAQSEAAKTSKPTDTSHPAKSKHAGKKHTKKLPPRPGQAVYLARMKVMSTYKDLTEVMPERIGPPNRYGVPPDHFDVAIEPLIEDYADLFKAMQAPPAFAQASDTPFRDVVDLGRIIASAKGADDATAETAGRIALGIFFAETNGRQNIGNARSEKYKGSLQTGTAENRRGARKWAAIKAKVAALDPALSARDDAEEKRSAGIDPRFNHWIAVRNGLMNAHADLFADIPAIARMLPDEIDQMKLFQLIQIVPTPTRAALASGDVAAYEVRNRRVMGFLRNNSIFTFGKDNRARTKATYREILDAMWLFDAKFAKAKAKYEAIRHGSVE
ncbi:MAG: hypothetical protein AB7V40_11375 [Methyloceanibacter sp.]